jgi:hypothetical protein
MILTPDQIAKFRDAAAHRPREIRDGFLGYLVWVGVGELEMILASHEELRAERDQRRIDPRAAESKLL